MTALEYVITSAQEEIARLDAMIEEILVTEGPERQTSDSCLKSIFILAATSALVVGINGKLKGKLNNEATLVIQQDLEKVRYAATQFGYQVKVGSTTITPATNINSTSLFKTVYSDGTTIFSFFQ